MSVYVDTVGYSIDITARDQDATVIDISPGNGALTLDVKKPDGTMAVWTPTVTAGPAGQASYATVAGDLDQVGTYCLQGHWDPTGDTDHYSSPFTITVRSRV